MSVQSVSRLSDFFGRSQKLFVFVGCSILVFWRSQIVSIYFVWPLTITLNIIYSLSAMILLEADNYYDIFYERSPPLSFFLFCIMGALYISHFSTPRHTPHSCFQILIPNSHLLFLSDYDLDLYSSYGHCDFNCLQYILTFTLGWISNSMKA